MSDYFYDHLDMK